MTPSGNGGRMSPLIKADDVIGFASYLIADGMAEIAELFVDPAHVRCGVAAEPW